MEKIKVSEIRKELIWKFGKNRISALADKDNLIITVSRSTFLAAIPICSIVEMYIIIEKGSSFYLKSIPFRKDFQRT